MNQLSIDFAVRQGQRGMTQAQVRAEHAQPGFTQDAAGWILRYLREHGPLPGEMLTDLAKAAGHVPTTDDRAFGRVFRMLSERGEIRQVGWCERRKGHGCGGGRIWKAE